MSDTYPDQFGADEVNETGPNNESAEEETIELVELLNFLRSTTLELLVRVDTIEQFLIEFAKAVEGPAESSGPDLKLIT